MKEKVFEPLRPNEMWLAWRRSREPRDVCPFGCVAEVVIQVAGVRSYPAPNIDYRIARQYDDKLLFFPSSAYGTGLRLYHILIGINPSAVAVQYA